MKGAVRQTRGPGMNLGMKKPRTKMAAPKDIVFPGAKNTAPANSYLPSGPFGATKKPKKPRL